MQKTLISIVLLLFSCNTLSDSKGEFNRIVIIVSEEDKFLVKILLNKLEDIICFHIEKQIAKVIRYVAKSIAMDEKFSKNISVNELEQILGLSISKDKYENNDVAGVVTGLAWTQLGGDILFIESTLSKGKITITHGTKTYLLY